MSYIGQKPAERVLTSADISDAAITADKLASSSVTQPKVNSGVAGTGPAFSASHNTGGDQSVSANTWTKALFETEDWDTNNNYSSSRFTPTVAGYYQISASVYAGAGVLQVRVYKNGSVWRQVGQSYIAGNASICGGSTLVYCNGSTDYVEIYASTSTTSFYTGFENFWFCGALVRAA